MPRPVRPTRRRILLRAAVALAAAVLAAAAALALALRFVPFPEDNLARLPASVVLTDRHGTELHVHLGPGDMDCRPGYVPEPGHWIVRALVAAEDKRFWDHRGIDFVAIVRAAFQDLASFRRVSGASTISTQVIRMVGQRPRTLRTKLVEAFQALQLERRHGKLEILRAYLNRAPFGSNLVGIEAAARRYFGKGAHELSLAEAALLAGVPQSPARLRPDRHPERAKKRQAYVLGRMLDLGFVTQEEYDTAIAQPLAARPLAYPDLAPHFCRMVGVSAPPDGHLLRTTLDLDWQAAAEGILSRRLAGTPFTGTIVVLDAATSSVRALVGSPDFRALPAGQVNAALSPRAAGSTLKPFAYALAFDTGRLVPASPLADVRTRFRDYDPANYDPGFLGSVPARDALVLSLNLPAIAVEQLVGQPRLHAALRALGLSTLDPSPARYGLGLVLGNPSIRPLDLANAYAALARGGVPLPLRTLETPAPPAPAAPVLSPEACWLVSTILSGDERAMALTAHVADVPLPVMAWKTGTSSGNRDAWTVAWNAETVVAVWIGRPDGAADPSLVGIETAAPLAWEFFRWLYPLNTSPPFLPPAGIERRPLCAKSGCDPAPACPAVTLDYAIARVTLHHPCPLHAGRPAAAPPSAANAAPAEATPAAATSFRIASPPHGSTWRLLPDDLAPATQTLPLDAAGLPPGTRLYWFLDDLPLGESRLGTPLPWPLRRGTHTLSCATPSGQVATLSFTVE